MAMTHQSGNRLFLNEKGGHGAEEGRALRKGGRETARRVSQRRKGDRRQGAERSISRAGTHQHGETAVCRDRDTTASWERIGKGDLTLQVCEIK